MQILRTLQTNSAGDSDKVLLDNWPKGMPAEGVYLDLELPVTVGTGGTPTVADLRALLDGFIGQFSLSYGREKQFKPWVAMKGSKLRHAHRLMTLREVTNDFVGVVQTVGNKTWHARVFLTPNRQKAKGRRRLIGWTQGATIELEVTEAAAITAGALNLSRNGNVPFVMRVVPAYRNGPNAFSHFPHYREINRDALDLLGPDGLTLAMWDDNAAFSATAIQKFNLRIGESHLYRLVEPRFMDDEFSRLIDAGGSDFTDEVTLLHAADPFADERELPTGPAYFELVAQDVATIKGRFLFLPPYDEAQATAIALEAAIGTEQAVNAVLPEPLQDPTKNGNASVAPIEFIGPRDARFDSEPGVRATKDGGAEVFVPPYLAGAARGLSPALLQRVQKVASLRVPGATTTSGTGRVGAIRDAVRGVFGG